MVSCVSIVFVCYKLEIAYKVGFEEIENTSSD